MSQRALLPKSKDYVRNLDNSKTMSFFIKYEELLVKYNEISSEIKRIIKRTKSNSILVSDNKYLKAKEKSYNSKINSNFNNSNNKNN